MAAQQAGRTPNSPVAGGAPRGVRRLKAAAKVKAGAKVAMKAGAVVLAVSVLVSILVSVSVPSHALLQGPHRTINSPADALTRAVRGEQTVLNSPPSPPYPTGPCDSIAAGLPGLAGSTKPATAVSIGRSVEGREIWAEYWGPASAATQVVVVAQVHGNECAPTLLAEEIRRQPPAGYGIWLIPTLNPDGYASYRRRNANGVDLNADGGARSQPETQALFALVDAVRPALTVHVHAPNGFMGAYPAGAPVATRLCGDVAVRTAMVCSSGGAGVRGDVSRWFLWQGLAPFGGESLLMELRAVAAAEVPTARPRPPTLGVALVQLDAARVVEALNAQFD